MGGLGDAGVWKVSCHCGRRSGGPTHGRAPQGHQEESFEHTALRYGTLLSCSERGML